MIIKVLFLSILIADPLGSALPSKKDAESYCNLNPLVFGFCWGEAPIKCSGFGDVRIKGGTRRPDFVGFNFDGSMHLLSFGAEEVAVWIKSKIPYTSIIPEKRRQIEKIFNDRTADMYETAKRCIINAYDEFMADDVIRPPKREISDEELNAVWESMKRSIEDFDAKDSGSGGFVSLSDDVKYPLEFIYGVKGAKKRILDQAELVAAHLRKADIELPRRSIIQQSVDRLFPTDRTIRGLKRLADQKLPPIVTRHNASFDIWLALATFVKGKSGREKLLTPKINEAEEQTKREIGLPPSSDEMFSSILNEYKQCARTFPDDKVKDVDIQMSDSPIPLWQIKSDAKLVIEGLNRPSCSEVADGLNEPSCSEGILVCGRTLETLDYLAKLIDHSKMGSALMKEIKKISSFVKTKATNMGLCKPEVVEYFDICNYDAKKGDLSKSFREVFSRLNYAFFSILDLKRTQKGSLTEDDPEEHAGEPLEAGDSSIAAYAETVCEMILDANQQDAQQDDVKIIRFLWGTDFAAGVKKLIESHQCHK